MKQRAVDPRSYQALRYLAPNLVTLASLLFGILSIGASLQGRFIDAGWFTVLAVLTDKLDGWVARLVRGESELGVQLDSFADFLNFGIAPATLWYAFFAHWDAGPFAAGIGHDVLIGACVVWVLAVTFRLARYNIVGNDPSCDRIFFGVPTTLQGGMSMALFLACLKYSNPAIAAGAGGHFEDVTLFGEVSLEPVLRVWPYFMLGGAFLMASAVRIPKLKRSRSRALTIFIFMNVIAGYAFGVARVLPEYLAIVSALWIVSSIVWGQVSPHARALRPPRIFPSVAPEPAYHPEDDLETERDLDAA
jgi:CDP-diacylglycerol--serine O-phosphatidyltransferase